MTAASEAILRAGLNARASVRQGCEGANPPAAPATPAEPVRPPFYAAAFAAAARIGFGMRANDFDAQTGQVFIAESKSGKARHIPLTARGQAVFERLAADRRSVAALLQRGGEA